MHWVQCQWEDSERVSSEKSPGLQRLRLQRPSTQRSIGVTPAW